MEARPETTAQTATPTATQTTAQAAKQLTQAEQSTPTSTLSNGSVHKRLTPWTVQESEEVYQIDKWGAGFFRINQKGNIAITPHDAAGPQLDLLELVEDLQDRGIRSPMLIRFPDIVRSRIRLINECFARAISDCNYQGKYAGVYPIKVNQQRHLVKQLVEFGEKYDLGLEAGSKPELLVVLALMKNPKGMIIANGFKDAEYIETALLSQKLGRNTIIVVDRASELPMIIDAAKRLNCKPRIGFRAKIYTKGAGKWQDSAGARSKFGLTPPEVVAGLQLLKSEKMLDSLELVHFHIGSQITHIQSVKASMKEGARVFAELYAMGARPRYIDVGGGLGVDYDGSRESHGSMDYDEQEYANDVVSIIQGICDERNIPHPNIITESGRALVAHQSLLVFNVLGVHEVAKQSPGLTVSDTDHKVIKSLLETYEGLSLKNVHEYYHDILQAKEEVLQLFNLGYLSLEQRAKAENLYWAILTKIGKLARENEEELSDLLGPIEAELSDTYFCNFSVFQSTPDAWAVGQVFPIMPIHRLAEEPRRRATLVDLTCDSDGKLDKFISETTTKNSLEVHYLQPNTPYYLGVFLIGAYQEILGDFHNLFGDPDAVHINISEAGYTVEHVVEGDTVNEVISYVQYDRSELVDNIRRATEAGIQRGSITKHEARLLMKHFEEGLAGYTYLEEPEV